MKQRGHLPLLVLLLFLVSCGGNRPAAPTAQRTVGGTPPPGMYRVERGDTLYSIAWQSGLDYHAIARWNGIAEPYLILPGQQLRLTEPPRRANARRHPVVPPPTAKPPVAKRPPPVVIAPPMPLPEKREPSVAPSPAPTIAPTGPSRTVAGVAWRWPTRGALFRTYHPTDPARNGIDIAGQPGQPVYAAAAGRVVYSGNGLVGYGNLIIIKHNTTYLSAYAHNRELLVSEGDTVALGQLIAKMGRVDNERALLHFEVRRNGTPIDPMHVLPKG